jgi:hypothetical protein
VVRDRDQLGTGVVAIAWFVDVEGGRELRVARTTLDGVALDGDGLVIGQSLPTPSIRRVSVVVTSDGGLLVIYDDPTQTHRCGSLRLLRARCATRSSICRRASTS